MSRRVGGAAGATVASPCINICKMEDGLCVGCFRTLDEIASWSRMTPEQQRAVLGTIPQRAQHPKNA